MAGPCCRSPWPLETHSEQLVAASQAHRHEAACQDSHPVLGEFRACGPGQGVNGTKNFSGTGGGVGGSWKTFRPRNLYGSRVERTPLFLAGRRESRPPLVWGNAHTDSAPVPWRRLPRERAFARFSYSVTQKPSTAPFPG